MEVVEILKAVADETRARILNLLYREPLCVCDLEAVLKLSQSNASRHVTKLKNAKLITGEKQAQWIYYKIDNSSLERYSFLTELLTQELAKNMQCNRDIERLKKYRERGGGCERMIKIDEE